MTNEVVNKSIYDKIIDKGSLDASEIIKLGKEKAKTILDDIISEANQDTIKVIKNSKRANQDKIGLIITNNEREFKKEILFKKKELIDKLFIEVLNELKNLDDKSLFNLVKKSILNESINKKEIIKVNKADYKKYLSLFSSGEAASVVELDKLNKELGKDYNLKISNDPVNIDGGFIIISEFFDINLSFTSILNSIKEKEETAIAEILYKEEI